MGVLPGGVPRWKAARIDRGSGRGWQVWAGRPGGFRGGWVGGSRTGFHAPQYIEKETETKMSGGMVPVLGRQVC